MIVLGITGSIGMGKSTVSALLRDMGVPVHDADAAVHKLLAAGGAGVAPVAAAFPETAQINEAGQTFIDRATLGRIVFSNPAKKKALEDILHPLVRQESDKFRTTQEKLGKKIIALDIPLLFETGGETRVDKVLCVSAPAGIQRSRVLARAGMTEEKFEKILKEQMPDAKKRQRADFVIDTGKTLDETRTDLQRILHDLNVAEPKNGNTDARNRPRY